MKFYFCEGCNKRLTEADIEQGKARDKQAKGFYCEDCAKGVNTMRFEAITVAEANKVLGRPEVPPEKEKPPGRKTTGSIPTLPASSATTARRPKPHAVAQPEPAGGGKTMAYVAAGAVLTGVLTVLMWPGDARKNDHTAAAHPTAQQSAQTLPPATNNHRAEPPATAPPTLPVSPQKTPEPAPAPGPQPPPPEAAETAPAPVTAPAAAPPAEPTEQKTPAAPAVKEDVKAPATESPAPAPDTSISAPKRTNFSLDQALDLASSGTSLADAAAKIKAGLPEADAGEKPRIEVLLELCAQADRVESAVHDFLRGKTGQRMAVTTSAGIRRFVTMSEGAQGALMADFGQGAAPLNPADFAPTQIQEFSSAKLGDDEAAKTALAAWHLLRGDPDAAARMLNALPEATQAKLRGLLDARRTKAAETKAAQELEQFKLLREQDHAAQALALGKQILERFAATRAVASLQPPLDLQLAELEARSSDLYNVFLCDSKKLPDGRVALAFDFAKPQHLAELENRGLAARFTELDLDITLENDSRWMRVLNLGEMLCIHHVDGREELQSGAKKVSQELKNYNPKHDYYGGPVGGVHRYRVKAGPAGVTCQIDEDSPLTLQDPWKGGALKWPGHYKIIPQKLALTGKLDPIWVAEMAEAAKARTAYFAGGWVDLKPQARRAPLEIKEPWFNSFSYGLDKEKRTVAGWHECGASWRIEGQEWLSPAADYRPKFHSRFWPMALAGSHAELAFEARLDKGFIEIESPGNFDWQGQLSVCIYPDKVALQGVSAFDGEPGTHRVTIVKEATRQPNTGQWQRVQLVAEKDKLRVLVDGVQVLDCANTPGPGTWAFWSYPGCEFRLRNVKVRKLE